MYEIYNHRHYFTINGTALYIEKVLLFFQEIPFLFVCIDDKGNRYFCLCQDTDIGTHLICKVSTDTLLKYLKSEISFTDMYESTGIFYRVEVGEKEDFSDDIITEIASNEFKDNTIYEEEVYFNAYLDYQKQYIRQLETERKDKIKNE